MEGLYPSPGPPQERREGFPSPTSTSHSPLQGTAIRASFWGQASLDRRSAGEEPVRITCDSGRAPGLLANDQALLREILPCPARDSSKVKQGWRAAKVRTGMSSHSPERKGAL